MLFDGLVYLVHCHRDGLVFAPSQDTFHSYVHALAEWNDNQCEDYMLSIMMAHGTHGAKRIFTSDKTRVWWNRLFYSSDPIPELHCQASVVAMRVHALR